MKVRPLPTSTGERTAEVLREAANAFTNVRGAGHTGFDLYNAYMRAAADQVKALGYVLPAADLERLVTTPRYWMLHNIDPAGKTPVLPWLLSLELDEKIAALESAARSVAEEIQGYSGIDVVLVPDTNVLLHHAQSVKNTNWSELAGGPNRTLVAVPILVVDELDRAKLNNGKIASTGEQVRTRAGRTLATFEAWFQPEPTHTLTAEPYVEVALVLGDLDRPRLPDSDAEIIDTAVSIRNLSGARTVIVSLDLGMRLRARVAGLEAVSTEPGELPY